jgi:hypothetical protein
MKSVTTTTRSRAYQTGKYTMPVVVDNIATDILVTTSLATYGAWLEGTGSRNLTTRFKGYHNFRQATQQVEMRAGDIAEKSLAPFVDRMNA